ncbi:amidase [Alphaproteobacteria bacterium KMM 3653]|uniref:Amidase n=1 Tax=Harenicola maris TaxID=2841044 RepID=A0AAP2CQG6_9RHOB|nr:amidase [Harenicola maris]
MDRWLTETATAIGQAIDTGDVDPAALTDAFLEAIEGHEFGHRIYARTTEKRARAEAAAAAKRAKLGQRRGLYDGVPISWKDLFDTAGTATESGTQLLKGRTPDVDAWVLQNATNAGMVCLGKTHMTELAFSGLGLNPMTESPPCVNDHDAVSGGSSSGAATSVAFGLATAGIGSDTGGSVRVPAAWNDLVGLKTTSGRLPLTGVVPLCARFDTIGPLCRSVADAAGLLAVMENTKAPDLRGASLEGARLLVLETIALDDVRPGPLDGFNAAVKRLEAAGAQVQRGISPAVADAMALSGTLFAPEAYATWGDAIEARPDLMYPEIRERFRGGASVQAPDYIRGWQDLERFRAEYLAETAGFDAVLAPTTPILPPNHDRLMQDSDYFVTENLLALRNTRIGNLLGLCAVTLPTGLPSTGLMMMTPPLAEARLLRLAQAAEAALTA